MIFKAGKPFTVKSFKIIKRLSHGTNHEARFNNPIRIDSFGTYNCILFNTKGSTKNRYGETGMRDFCNKTFITEKTSNDGIRIAQLLNGTYWTFEHWMVKKC